jgi:hypothetical protein
MISSKTTIRLDTPVARDHKPGRPTRTLVIERDCAGVPSKAGTKMPHEPRNMLYAKAG